jgi:hypothetical protein
MAFPSVAVVQNNDRGPCTRTKSFWAGAVGADLTAAQLVFCGNPPRRLYVGSAGNLVLVHTDGNNGSYSDTMTGIVAGAYLFDSSIIGVTASGSTAFNLTFGW